MRLLFSFLQEMTTIFHGVFKFVMFACPVIKHDYGKLMIIARIIMISWFAFLMHKQSNNLGGNG